MIRKPVGEAWIEASVLFYPFIAAPPDCFNILRPQLVSDASDVFLHHSIVSGAVKAPHLFINCFPAEHLSRVEGKQFHYIKFYLGKFYGPTISRDGPCGVVHHNVSKATDADFLLDTALSAQVSLHPGSQFGQAERLQNVIITTGPQTSDTIRLLNPGG